MSLSHDKARNLFGKFIAFNQMLSTQQEVENFYGMSYRTDTWQMWANCEEEHLPSSRMLCAHAGLHLAIQESEETPNTFQFAVMMGPFDLLTGDDPELLYRQMGGSVKAILGTAQLHIHALGWPCHEECQCDSILSEEDYGIV